MSLGGAPKINKDNQEYRDNLAKDLKDMRSQGGRVKDFAQDVLDKQKTTEVYQNAREDILNSRNEAIQENHEKQNEQIEKDKIEAEKNSYMQKMAEKYNVEHPFTENNEDLSFQENSGESIESIDSLRNKLKELGNKIMQGPKDIIASFSESEKKRFISENPTERGYFENFIQDLNRWDGENGIVNYENSLKYVNFLKEIRGEDFSGKILPFSEVQLLRKEQSDILEKMNKIV